MKTIYLAGGCFWGIQAYFSKLDGVSFTEVGYANGNIKKPTYKDLLSGKATHAETVKIVYEGSLKTILKHFFRIINPYTLNRQQADIGIQYRSGIYYTSEADKNVILQQIEILQQKSGDKKVVIEVKPLLNYYKAEEEHQDYLTKNPGGYCHVDLSLLKKEILI